MLKNQKPSEIVYRPIGNSFSIQRTRGTHIQSVSAQNIEGTVEVYPDYVEGLEDLEGFSHIIRTYHFHLIKKYSLKVKPFLDSPSHGVLATRAPARPNPIGISTVRLVRIEKGKLYVQGMDIVDGLARAVEPRRRSPDMGGYRYLAVWCGRVDVGFLTWTSTRTFLG